MAAKTLEEALMRAEIKLEIKRAVCMGPLYELVDRIDRVEGAIVQKQHAEIKDLFAHQIMIFTRNLPEATQACFNNFFDQMFEVKNGK